MKIHDLLAQHIFPSKRHTTYECIPELVVTVPSARSTIVKKKKWFIIWLYKWSRVTFTELLSAVVKIPWHYHHFPWLSLTFAIFHDFPGLENGLPKFHDFPWPGGVLLKTSAKFANNFWVILLKDRKINKQKNAGWNIPTTAGVTMYFFAVNALDFSTKNYATKCHENAAYWQKTARKVYQLQYVKFAT